jgi:hypothetical protein
MIPMGQIGERMVVAKVDRMAGRFSIMCPPTMKEHSLAEGVPDAEIFMTGYSMGNTFDMGEINQFLQAMMEAGWKRGLRPKNFDPSAGELAAVQRHLEDMRRVAMNPYLPPVGPTNPGLEALQQAGAASHNASLNPDIGVDPDKTW